MIMYIPNLTLFTSIYLSASLSSFSAGVAGAALECGTWLTHACLGDIDDRYNPDYTNNIIEQNDLWSKQDGFWMVTQTSTQVITHFNPFNLTATIGIPYDENEAVTFVNFTSSGSRRYEHRYVVYPPAPQDFCDLPVPPGSLNVLPPFSGAVCGVNGYASFVEGFKTSTYEKDGTLTDVGGSLGFADDSGFDPSENGKSYPVSDRSLSFSSTSNRADGGEAVTSKNWIFIGDDYNLARAVLEIYNAKTAELFSSTSYQYTRIASEEEFVEQLQAALIANNVQADVDSRGGPVPMSRACLGSSCPTEEDWCLTDPECSESPYQEPAARVKAGVIAGFCAAGAVILLAILSAYFLNRLRKQKERIKAQFAARVAATIDLGLESNIAMNPDALKKEFEKIDSGSKDGGDRYISKDELWAFMSSGKAGTMNKKDFDVLFLTLDDDGNGKVDYLEFVNFLSTCGAYVEKEVKEKFHDDHGMPL